MRGPDCLPDVGEVNRNESPSELPELGQTWVELPQLRGAEGNASKRASLGDEGRASIIEYAPPVTHFRPGRGGWGLCTSGSVRLCGLGYRRLPLVTGMWSLLYLDRGRDGIAGESTTSLSGLLQASLGNRKASRKEEERKAKYFRDAAPKIRRESRETQRMRGRI